MLNSSDSRRPDGMPQRPDINIEIDHLSVTGHVVFAGRDGQVKVQTGGDVAQHTNQTVTVGGVETTPQELDMMLQCIRSVEDTIKKENLDTQNREAAMHDLHTVEAQLTTSKKPNPRILMRAAKSLLRFSPALTAAALTLFDQPLVGAILASVGEVAINFQEAIAGQRAAKKI
ncbi:MAG: hypothetical protein OXI34_17985 [Chloroflexota bacterium]|nr:hypothetical protein [Chloroflexota bacterium]MDE2854517.1 hypothetical protein [Chloroflexota bacterium]MDE2945943.1 hypothetical protein [Chloroflexota bacterium]